MKRHILTLLVLIPAFVNAQQDPLYNSYLSNQLIINPAYAGIHEAMNLSLISRQQWAGIDGSPLTTNLSFQTSLSSHFGMGVMLLNDRLGINNNYEGQLSFAYHIKMSANKKLSFGVQGGFVSYMYDYSKLNLEVVDDPFLNTDQEDIGEFNTGFGIMFTTRTGYIGISVPRILEIEANDGVVSSLRYQRHYYASGGFTFNRKGAVAFKPSFLLKYVEEQPLSVDVNFHALFDEFLWAGIMIRNFESYGVNLQLQISDTFKFGYTFELPTNDLISQNYGTHELLVSFDFAPFAHQARSPRYF